MILREKDKKDILSLANNIFKYPIKILAYGSRVTGEAHDMSDLDLAIISKDKKKLNINNLIDFKMELTNSNIPILIQVFDFYRLPKYFHKNILENCEELK